MNILISMPKGYIRDSFIGGDVSQKIEFIGNVIWNEGTEQWSPEELRDKLEDMDVCITGWGVPRFDSKVLEKADRLKLLVHTGGTVAPVVSPDLYARGIRVVSGNDGYARSVAEGVIAYMLLGLRKLPHFIQEMKDTRWVKPSYYNEGLLDQTVGLIGFGKIAEYLIPLLKCFHTHIKVYSRHMTEEQAKAWGVERASIEEIMATCKIVSLHCASNAQNYHLINETNLKLLQDGALLLNTARGEVVDEDALADICSRRNITAVLDVYEQEDPVPTDCKLWDHENIIMIPHMCGPTVDQRRVIGRRLIHEIETFYTDGTLSMEIGEAAAARMTAK